MIKNLVRCYQCKFFKYKKDCDNMFYCSANRFKSDYIDKHQAKHYRACSVFKIASDTKINKISKHLGNSKKEDFIENLKNTILNLTESKQLNWTVDCQKLTAYFQKNKNTFFIEINMSHPCYSRLSVKRIIDSDIGKPLFRGDMEEINIMYVEPTFSNYIIQLIFKNQIESYNLKKQNIFDDFLKIV